MKPFIKIVCCLFLGLTIVQPLCAQTNNQQSLKQTQQLINDLTKEITVAQSKESRIQKRLRKQEQSLASVHQKLYKINQQVNQLEREAKFLEQQEQKQSQLLQEHKDSLNKTLTQLYVNGNHAPLKILLDQDDPEFINRMLVYYRYLGAARQEKIIDFQTTLEELKSTQMSLSENNNKLTQQQQDIATQQKQLKLQTSKRRSLLKTVQQQISSAEIKLKQQQENAAALERLVKRATEDIAKIKPEYSLDDFGEYKGKFNWPITGKVLHTFNSIRNGSLRWQGIFIQANGGQAVKNLHAGRVIFSDYMRGYGLIVIVDQQNGYLTLYGHNQSLLVSAGEWIEPSQVIAQVGTTGFSQKAGLYFEIRKKGKPINPLVWLKKDPVAARK